MPSRRPARAPRLRALLVTLLLLVSPLAGLRPAGADPGPSPDPLAAVLPAERDAVAAKTDGRLSTYVMDATLDPAASTIGGTAEVGFRNSAAVPLDEVWFRLFPNAAYYEEGGTEVRDVTVDGAPAAPTFAVGDTAMGVPLPTPLAPGATTTITFAFTSTVPADSTGSFGIFSHDTAGGTWVLADWHPVLAVYVDGEGWALPEPTEAGDPTFAESAFYDVTLHAPESLRVVAPGEAVGTATGDGIRTDRFVAGPAREFTLVADDDYVTDSRTVDGTTITLHTNPGRDAAVRQRTLDVAARSLEVFGQAFGPYPFQRLEIVDVPLGQSLGIAWTGLIFLDGRGMFERFGQERPADFATVVAHEVSHLWWGATVGADTNSHAYLAEGLATVSALLYQEEAAGPDVARSQFDLWVVGPAESLLRDGDVPVDRPVAAGEDQDVRAWAAYGKATLGFTAIREQIGSEAFVAGLNAYADRWQFGVADPADLRAAWEGASGQDLADLWATWFDRAEMTQAAIEAVAAGYLADAERPPVGRIGDGRRDGAPSHLSGEGWAVTAVGGAER